MSGTKETREHIEAVILTGLEFTDVLEDQLSKHDDSKLKEPEVSVFDDCTGTLKDIEYGSEEYKEWLKILQPTLEHHYTHNRHHPEHFENGVAGMNLADLCEMFCDWFASSKRCKDGDIRKSIKQNQERFGFSDDLCSILMNTVDLLEPSYPVSDDSVRECLTEAQYHLSSILAEIKSVRGYITTADVREILCILETAGAGAGYDFEINCTTVFCEDLNEDLRVLENCGLIKCGRGMGFVFLHRIIGCRDALSEKQREIIGIVAKSQNLTLLADIAYVKKRLKQHQDPNGMANELAQILARVRGKKYSEDDISTLR